MAERSVSKKTPLPLAPFADRDVKALLALVCCQRIANRALQVRAHSFVGQNFCEELFPSRC